MTKVRFKAAADGTPPLTSRPTTLQAAVLHVGKKVEMAQEKCY